jgi:structural maintenance of chromosome 1
MITKLEIENFKSWSGSHTIEFKDLTCVIGPNGSGKSNLLDAISFVLGVNRKLRSNYLRELISIGQHSCKVCVYFVVSNDDASQDSDSTIAQNDSVVHGKSVQFTRSVNSNNVSEFFYNGASISQKQYHLELEKLNILVKARNFLVFQGDIESIANQSPKDLTKLMEQISGSLKFKEEYDDLKRIVDEKTESLSITFKKKQTMSMELKQFKQQKQQLQKFEKLKATFNDLVIKLNLMKLASVNQKVEDLLNEIQKQSSVDESMTSEVDKSKLLKQEMAKISKKLLVLEKKTKSINQQIADCNPLRFEIKEELTFNEQRLQTLKEIVDTNEAAIKDQELALKRLHSDLRNVEIALSTHEQEVEALTSRKGVVLQKADLQQYKKLSQQRDSQTLSQSKELKTLDRQIANANDSITRYNNDLQSKYSMMQSLKEQQADYERQLSNVLFVNGRCAKKYKGQKNHWKILAIGSVRLILRIVA